MNDITPAPAREGWVPRKSPWQLRDQAWNCNDANLTTFAKLLFHRMTDLAFDPHFKRGEGYLDISKEALAEEANKSVDTVTRAARALAESGFIWTRIIWVGGFEITRWFIRDWADDKYEYDPHSGGTHGRRPRGVQRNTLRAPSGKFKANPESRRQKERAAMKTVWEAENRTVKAEISPDHGENSALSGQTNQPCDGAPISPDTVQQSALSGQTNQPCHPAPISGVRAEESAVSGCNSQPCQGAPTSGLNNLRDDPLVGEGVLFKRSTELNAQKAGRGPRKASAENIFLLDVGEVMDLWKKGHSKTEMTGSGAWWRRAYQADRDLIDRVLRETRRAVKEGDIKTNPGAYAVDLWKRWNGPSLIR